jgi:hypothetical protein
MLKERCFADGAQRSVPMLIMTWQPVDLCCGTLPLLAHFTVTAAAAVLLCC